MWKGVPENFDAVFQVNKVYLAIFRYQNGSCNIEENVKLGQQTKV